MANDRLRHEIAKLLFKMGANGVRIHDGGVEAVLQNNDAIRIEVKPL